MGCSAWIFSLLDGVLCLDYFSLWWGVLSGSFLAWMGCSTWIFPRLDGVLCLDLFLSWMGCSFLVWLECSAWIFSLGRGTLPGSLLSWMGCSAWNFTRLDDVVRLDLFSFGWGDMSRCLFNCIFLACYKHFSSYLQSCFFLHKGDINYFSVVCAFYLRKLFHWK